MANRGMPGPLKDVLESRLPAESDGRSRSTETANGSFRLAKTLSPVCLLVQPAIPKQLNNPDENLMSVNSDDLAILSSTAVFESRFDDAYRYYDRCGEVISRIRKLDSNWVPLRIDAQTGALANKALGLRLVFDDRRMSVGRTTSEWVPASTAAELVQTLGPEAETLYSLITDTLQVPNSIRIGARFDFQAPADSMEDAERFLSKSLRSDLSKSLEDELTGTLYESSTVYRIDESKSGIRRSVQIHKVSIMDASDPGLTGLPGDLGKAAVEIDVDSYTRPDEGHFNGLSDFIQRSFSKSKVIAHRMFREMRSKQR